MVERTPVTDRAALTPEMLAELRQVDLRAAMPNIVRSALPDLLACYDAMAAQTRELEAEIGRLSGHMCLLCGRDEPCSETPEGCTFDPSPIDAAKRFQGRAEAAEAEVARLKEALRPFGIAAKRLLHPSEPNERELILAEVWNSAAICTYGDLRRAARALGGNHE